jgi:hypothetical protein
MRNSAWTHNEGGAEATCGIAHELLDEIKVIYRCPVK